MSARIRALSRLSQLSRASSAPRVERKSVENSRTTSRDHGVAFRQEERAPGEALDDRVQDTGWTTPVFSVET